VPIDESLSFKPIRIAVLTVSDTRTPETDTSGQTLKARIEAAGHTLHDYRIVKDNAQEIEERVRFWIFEKNCDAIISTGGTGVTGRDVTPEAMRKVWDKEIEGFGELFRWISFQTIGTSTVQSRACGGVARGTYIFALPGSTGAVKDGWDKILKDQLDSRHKPCNFVELMPRLKEK
jgi:molybdopterin adenylyltransferase